MKKIVGLTLVLYFTCGVLHIFNDASFATNDGHQYLVLEWRSQANFFHNQALSDYYGYDQAQLVQAAGGRSRNAPEPAVLLLLGLSMMGLASFGRRLKG